MLSKDALNYIDLAAIDLLITLATFAYVISALYIQEPVLSVKAPNIVYFGYGDRSGLCEPKGVR